MPQPVAIRCRSGSSSSHSPEGDTFGCHAASAALEGLSQRPGSGGQAPSLHPAQVPPNAIHRPDRQPARQQHPAGGDAIGEIRARQRPPHHRRGPARDEQQQEIALAKAQIGALGLGPRVRLAGVQPAREALRHGRCAVVPSLAESLPYVILEGSAAGRPVLSTDVGGIGEIFGPTSASLFPAADAAAMGAAMQRFMDDPAAALEEAKVRLDYIRPRFSIAHMADQIEALYREVLAKRRGLTPG